MSGNCFVPSRVRQRQKVLGNHQSWGLFTDKVAPNFKIRTRGMSLRARSHSQHHLYLLVPLSHRGAKVLRAWTLEPAT